MQLIRFGVPGHEKPGVLIEGKRKDLSQHFKDWDRDFFHQDGLKQLEKILKGNPQLPDVPEETRWASCIAETRKGSGHRVELFRSCKGIGHDIAHRTHCIFKRDKYCSGTK